MSLRLCSRAPLTRIWLLEGICSYDTQANRRSCLATPRKPTELLDFPMSALTPGSVSVSGTFQQPADIEIGHTLRRGWHLGIHPVRLTPSVALGAGVGAHLDGQ